jgi:hypothetical protein
VLDLKAIRGIWQGDHALVQSLIPQIEEAWGRVDPLYAIMSTGAKRFLVAALSGDAEEIDANDVRPDRGTAQYALPKPYLCALAFRRIEIGMLAEARDDFEYLSRHEYEDLQRDVAYLLTIVQLAQLAHDLHDPVRAARLEELMEPYAGRYSSGHTTAVRGAVDRYRGLTRWTQGDLDGADAFLCAAIEQEHKMRAPPWEALARLDRVRLLLQRQTDDDRESAAEELKRVDEILSHVDTPGFTDRADRLRAQFARG